jgi:hypothetical protein
MVPRKQAGHMTCTRPQGKRQILLAMRASSTHDPKQKICEHKVVRYLVGPPGGQNEDTRWWTFAFWAHRKAFSWKRL